ncbi:hypothetical protein [Nocardia sp. NPDC048505]|uniref:hypothetical protein n=1 Tax=unclassified Nocardia TaxID=2637762 RepID=UPI00340787AB
MPHEDPKQAAHRALVERILHGPGRAAPDQRAGAFHHTEVPAAVRTLIDKVVTNSAAITDADFAATGYSDDELFELVVCAAVGQSTRLYDAGLAALAEATGPEHP